MVIFKNLTNVQFKELKNAVSKDKHRTNLHGVFLDIKNQKLVVTNSKTIFAYDIKVNIALEDHGCEDVLIDPKVFNQDSWLSVPKEDFELVEFWVTEELTKVVLGGEVVAISKNLDHEHPFPVNWKEVMKLNEMVESVEVDPALLKSALSCIPKNCSFPKLTFGNKIKINSSKFNKEVEGEVFIVGVTMPFNFSESRIYDVSQRLDIEHEKKKNGDLSHLIGRELSKRVVKTWMEDFVDEDKGEVVSVERNEIILDRETILDLDSLAVLTANKVEEIFIIKKD